MNQNVTENGSWHLDKRVNVSMIFALIIQSVAIVWSVASIYAEIGIHEERLDVLDGMGSRTAVLEANIVSMSANIKDTKDSINRIEGLLMDRLQMPRGK